MGTRAKHQIAPKVRVAFLRALEKNRIATGKTFSDLTLEAIQENGVFWVLEKIGRFIESDRHVRVSGKVSHTHTHGGLPETDAFVAGVLEGYTEDPLQEPVQN